MFLKNTKVQTFTIVEILVVLILSGILMSTLYMAFQYLNKSFRIYQENKELIAEYQMFCQTIRNDFDLSVAVKYENEKLKCVFPARTVIYELSESGVSREINNSVSKFKCVIKDISVQRLMIAGRESNRYVKNLYLSGNVKGEKIVFFISKDYAADFLLRSELDDLDNYGRN